MRVKRKNWVFVLAALLCVCIAVAAFGTEKSYAAETTLAGVGENGLIDPETPQEELLSATTLPANFSPFGAAFGSDVSGAAVVTEKGEKAVKYGIWNWAERRYSVINFSEPIRAAGLSSLTLRVFAHFSSTVNPAYSSNNPAAIATGIWFFPADGKNHNGARVPEAIEQEKWVDLTFGAAEIANLADEDGMIRGIQLGSVMCQEGNEACLYNDAYLLVSDITISDSFSLEGATTSASQLTAILDHTAGDDMFGWPTATDIVLGDVAGEAAMQFGVHEFSGRKFPVINLNAPVALSEIESLTFRMYVHISEGNYPTSKGGVYFFAPDATGNGMGKSVMLPVDIAQDAWTEFTLTQDALLPLCSDGMFKGFSLAAKFDEPAGNMYSAGAYLAISEVKYKSLAEDAKTTYTISFGEDAEPQTVVRYGKATQPEAPVRSDYVFKGWYNGDILYDFNTLVTENLTLTAKFGYDEVEDYSAYLGTYRSGNALYRLLEENRAIRYEEGAFTELTYYVTKGGRIAFSEAGLADVIGSMETGSFELGGTEFVKGTELFIVNFDSNGGTPVEICFVEPGETVAIPEMPIRDGFKFAGWMLENNAYDFDAPVNADLTLTATWEDYRGILTDASEESFTYDNDPDLVLTYLNGLETLSADYPEWKGTRPLFTEANADATGGKVFRFNFSGWGMNMSDGAVVFNSPVKGSEIDSLTIRVYAHLSSAATYDTTYGGVRLYGLDADGSGSGFLIPAGVTQDEWVTLRLNKQAIAELCDKDGVFRGFKMGAAFLSDTNSKAYMGASGQPGSPYLLIDCISVSEQKTATFMVDGEVWREDAVFTGITYDYDIPMPSKDGMIFAGWYLGEEAYDFATTISEDVTLTAKFLPAGSIADAEGIWEKSGLRLKVYADGRVEGLADYGRILYTGISAARELIVQTERKAYRFDLAAFTEVPSVKVTYVNGFTEDEVVLYPKDAYAEDREFDYPSCIFEGWLNEEGEAFDFASPLTGDVTLYADLSYVQDDDAQEDVQASYYAENGGMWILGADNVARYVSASGETEYNYVVLSSREIVFENADGVLHGTAFSGRIEIDGISFLRLYSYFVTFETDGAGEIAQQTISDGDFRATKPADPVKEGYTFAGWFLSDGTEFDFNSVINESVTLYAKWTAAAPEKTSGCGAKSSANMGALLLLLGLQAAVVIGKRR